MGNRGRIIPTYYRSEKLLPVGNSNRWTCLFDDNRAKLYISECPGYTMVGVCDNDDFYIRAEFKTFDPAKRLYDRIAEMPIIFIADLLALGMQYD